MASKLTSLIPQNGTTFTGSLGRKIIFQLEPSLGYVDGRHSYLSLDILNTSTDYQRLALAGTAGAAAVINRIDTYALGTGQHLETLENYNQIVGLLNQYEYEDPNNIQTLEGCGDKVKAFYSSTTSDPQGSQPVYASPDNINDSVLSPISVTAQPLYKRRRFVCPLKLGLFRWYDDERLCPVLMLSGLRIEITLEDPKVALRAIQGHKTGNGEDTYHVDLFTTGIDCENTDNSLTFLTSNNETESPAETGFAVGNKVTVAGDATSATRVISAISRLPATIATAVAVACDDLAAPGNSIVSTADLSLADGQCVAGDMLNVYWTPTAGGVATTDRKRVEAVALNGAKFQITIMGDPLPISTAISWTRLQTIKYEFTTAVAFGNDANVFIKLTSDNRSYEVTPELKILSIPPPRNMPMQEVNYQFTSYDMFVDSLPSSARKHQQEIPSVATKAVAINTLYVEVGKEDLRDYSSYFASDAPVKTKLNSVQYYLNNTLFPVQAYNPGVFAERVICDNENVKALATINRDPKDLGSSDGADLDIYTNSFIHSRELAREQFVFDLASAEPQIRLAFSGTRTDNYTLHTLVWSKKIVNISSNGLQVIL